MPGANGEVAEPLSRMAFPRKLAEKVAQSIEDRRLADVSSDHPVEALAMKTAADIKIILAGGPAGKPDLAM